MAKVDGGVLFGEALRREGVEKAFVLCGGHIMPIFYGMRQAGIEIVDLRHEVAASYAAETYAQVTGKPAALITTAGPGVTNTVTGMYEALSRRVPLIHIGGASPTGENDTGELQDMPTFQLMESCTRWARKIYQASRIPEYVSMAVRHATELTPGPVYLEIGQDVLFERVDPDTVHYPEDAHTEALPFGDPALIEQAADLLAAAERPAMLIDDAARFSAQYGDEAIPELVDYLKIPTGTRGMSRGLFADESKNLLFNLGSGTAMADVILSLCPDYNFMLLKGRAPLFNRDAKIICVHPDKGRIGYNTRADIGIVGGAGPVAKQLLAAVKKKTERREDMSWVESAQQLTNTVNQRYTDAAVADSSPVHPGRCAAEVAKFLDEEAQDWTVAIDGGDASQWMGGVAKARRPGQIVTMGPTGNIGMGPAKAIGAWVASRKPVLWYTGDGSFGFNAMELDTMAKLNVPVICVISNDSAWGMIKLSEDFIHPDEVEGPGHCNVDLHHMRAYHRMVEMWDGHGEVVTEASEIIPALRRAAANGKPSIINVEVDKTNMSPMTQAYAASFQRTREAQGEG